MNNTVHAASAAIRDSMNTSLNTSVIASAHTKPVNAAHASKRKHRRHYHRGRRNTTPRANNNFKTVINLSDRVLSEPEISILSKGLKFVPTPNSVNKTELITDIKRWGRRMRLKEYFWNDGETTTKEIDSPTYNQRALKAISLKR